MNIDYINMAISGMDTVALSQEFKRLCQEGPVDGTVIFRFLMYAIPQYEANKKELLSQALEKGIMELTSQIWEDPLNPTPYSQINTLKRIANYLNISIDAIRK